MPAFVQPTVERLDKPSAYYLGRVGTPLYSWLGPYGYFTELKYDRIGRIRSVSMVETEMTMMWAVSGRLRNQRIP